MRLEARQLALALLLALFGAAAWWYQHTQTVSEREAPVTASQPDYTADDLAAVMMDATGQPQRRLQARQLRHYAHDDHSELVAPVLWLRRRAGEPPWQLRADHGVITARGQQVQLTGNVLAERVATPTSPALTVRTSAIVIFPETHYAETERFVALQHGRDWTTAAHGMRLWFGDQRRVQLVGRVRAQLVPAIDPVP